MHYLAARCNCDCALCWQNVKLRTEDYTKERLEINLKVRLTMFIMYQSSLLKITGMGCDLSDCSYKRLRGFFLIESNSR